MERAIVVTGTSSGIGHAVVEAAVRAGFIAYGGVRNGVDAARLQTIHPNVRPLQLDVTDAAEIDAAAQRVRSHGVRVVGLINNAGIAFGGPLETLPIEDLRRQFDVNCVGAIAVTQAFLPLLREQPSRVVFVGSVSGRIAMPYVAPYSASKFALRALADALRVELAPQHIEVCLVEPGSVATPIWKKGSAMREAMLARLSDESPAYYRKAIEAVMRMIEGEERAGMPAERVAAHVMRALTDRKPKARAVIGMSARIGALLALLPPSLHDRFMRATMRLP